MSVWNNRGEILTEAKDGPLFVLLNHSCVLISFIIHQVITGECGFIVVFNYAAPVSFIT